MSSALAKTDKATSIEKVLIQGDLAPLTPEQRVSYYNNVCESIGLNPLTKPFEYIRLNGKLTLYARKDCTDQLRKIHRVSIENVQTEKIGDLYQVTVTARMPDGRTDSDVGVLFLKGISPADIPNAIMKCLTKAKRRVTLSICGLGLLDESEVDDVRANPAIANEAHQRLVEAEPTQDSVDESTGEIEEGAQIVEVNVPYKDAGLRAEVKALGFQWDKERKVWSKPLDADEAQGYEFEYTLRGES